MTYTVGEMAQKLGVPASTLRYYDKEGLLPFVERSSGGIRMFRGNRLRVAAGHPLRAVLAPLQAAGNAYILGGEKPLTGCAYKRRWAYYCKDLGMAQSGCFLRHFYDILKK